jgi:hypothetical protein
MAMRFRDHALFSRRPAFLPALVLAILVTFQCAAQVLTPDRYPQLYGKQDRFRKIGEQWVDLGPLWWSYQERGRPPLSMAEWRYLIGSRVLQVTDGGLLIIYGPEVLYLRNLPNWEGQREGGRLLPFYARISGTHSYETASGKMARVTALDYGTLPTAEELRELGRKFEDARIAAAKAKQLADGKVLAEAEKRLVENQKKRAMDGSDLAQYELGMRHLAGAGVEPNVPEGIRLLKAAAAAGNVSATRHLDVERALNEWVPRSGISGEPGGVSKTASDMEFTLVPMTQRPLARFDAARFAKARELMTRGFAVGMEEFVRSGSALFDAKYISGWGADFAMPEADNSLPAKPSYLLGAFANSPKADDGILWRTCYGIQAGTNSARLIQVELASGWLGEGKLNGGYPGALDRNLKSCLTSLGLVRLADAENWIKSAVSSELAPLFQMRVKSADPTLTTDGTLRLFSEKFDSVRLAVRTYEHAFLRNETPVLNNEPHGREVLIRVYVVPLDGKVYLRKGEYGGYLLRLPPELKNQFADILDL